MRPIFIFLCVPAVVLFLLGNRVRALPFPGKLKELQIQAEFFERQGEWDKARLIYESILKGDRSLQVIKERYQHCLRRSWQIRRHRDPSYRKEVLSLEQSQAMRLYGMVLNALLDNGLEKKKINPGQLFRKGLEELRWALDSPEFCQAHIPMARPAELRAFLAFLDKTPFPVASRQDTRKQVREVALAASSMLQLSSTTVIMEFTCGACGGLDEYTTYLTPFQLRELLDSLRGDMGSVGLTLGAKEGKLVLAEVKPYSPAAQVMPPLAADDQVISVDRKASRQLTLALAQEMLEGPVGTTVDIVIHSPRSGNRTVTLRRRAMFMPSVNYHMLTAGIGYLQIICFQDTTLHELDQALAALGKDNMKALVLDLRGNEGGLFEVAIDVARRFLPGGIIASTQNYDPRFNTIYQARNPAAVTVPLVVLIDMDTASAAEVLAGALKENKRGRLVGQASFGKGCTQTIIKLPPASGGLPTGGLRITVARFFSPSGLPYSGRGVEPHLLVERFPKPDALEPDQQLEEARLEAQRLVGAN